MGRFSIPEPEYKLSRETGDAAVAELLGYYGINLGVLADDQREAIEAMCARLSGYYRLGLVENIREGGVLKVKQHLQDPPGEVREIVYGRIGGKHRLAGDRYKENERYAKLYAIMGSLSGLGETGIVALSGVDLSVVEVLGILFLFS